MSAKIMGQVFDLDLPRSQKSVLLALADHADHEGNNAHPGVGLLVYKTGFCERQVQRALAGLSDKGLITTDDNAGGGRGKKPVYSIHVEKGVKKSPVKKPSPQPGKGDIVSPFPDEKGDIQDAERVTLCPQKGDILDTPYTTDEPSLEPSLEPLSEDVAGPPLSDDAQTGLFADADPPETKPSARGKKTSFDTRLPIQLFRSAYEAAFGETPEIRKEHAHGLVQRYGSCGPAKFPQVLKGYLASTDSWAVSSGHDVATFLKGTDDRWLRGGSSRGSPVSETPPPGQSAMGAASARRAARFNVLRGENA